MKRSRISRVKTWFETQLANKSKINAGNLLGIVLMSIFFFWSTAVGFETIHSFVNKEVKILYENTVELFKESALLVGDLVYPQRHIPVARFTSNINWDTNTLSLDGSTSKTFDGQTPRYVWRIDDGSADNNAEKITHTFAHPGYYLIRLSVIDSNEQVDSATCQVFIPPSELEPVTTTSRSSGDQSQDQQETSSVTEWVPVGVFYNYTKMSETSNAALKSRYVESGCGFSDRNFNAIGLTIDRVKATSIISSLVTLVINVTFLVIGFKLLQRGSKKLSAYLTHS